MVVDHNGPWKSIITNYVPSSVGLHRFRRMLSKAGLSSLTMSMDFLGIRGFGSLMEFYIG